MNAPHDDPHISRDAALGAEERRIVAALRDGLDPGPRTPAQRSAFSRALEERIDARAAPWRPALLAAGSALAGLALWLAVPVAWGPAGGVAPASSPSLLAYAYYETDFLDDAPGEMLPVEYQALEGALALP